MMKKKKVIGRNNLRMKSPITPTILFLLALDYWGAPEWLWGIVVFITVIFWGVFIYSFWSEESLTIDDFVSESLKHRREGLKWSSNPDSKFQKLLKNKIEEL